MISNPVPHIQGFTVVSHAGNIKWLAIATAGLRAVLPAATLWLMTYTLGPVMRCFKAVWYRDCPSQTDMFGASLFGFTGFLGLGFFGKRVLLAMLEGRSLGFDSGAFDQWSSAACLLGASLSAMLGVWAVSRSKGHARYVMPAMILSMLASGIGFAFLYAWQQGAL